MLQDSSKSSARHLLLTGRRPLRPSRPRPIRDFYHRPLRYTKEGVEMVSPPSIPSLALVLFGLEPCMGPLQPPDFQPDRTGPEQHRPRGEVSTAG